jgi:hypothetical protein
MMADYMRIGHQEEGLIHSRDEFYISRKFSKIRPTSLTRGGENDSEIKLEFSTWVWNGIYMDMNLSNKI